VIENNVGASIEQLQNIAFKFYVFIVSICILLKLRICKEINISMKFDITGKFKKDYIKINHYYSYYHGR